MTGTCGMCSKAIAIWLDLCAECNAECDADGARIEKLAESGHTDHCAMRQVWGDGECECSGDGTDPGYHTMNPPTGGWRSRHSTTGTDAAVGDLA